MGLPQFILELVFVYLTFKALLRTLSYLKVKRQEYKLNVMKKFAVIFTLGAIVYVFIRASKLIFEIFN